MRTMKANYCINAGDISVIRPMVYCRESMMTEFAKSANLPVINENCPACFEEPKERARIKKLLLRESTLYPNLYDNLRRAMIPLMKDETSAILRCYTEEALAKSRREEKYSKNDKSQMKTEVRLPKDEDASCLAHDSAQGANIVALAGFSDDELLREVARRKALQYRLHGAMKRVGDNEDNMEMDPTGQVCTVDGRDGTIQCRDLFE